ncbi:transcription factor bHLH147, partial [Arachis ipaensis]|uniref:transcription factor bHLH147 n=1 Tax=Arachis ipaensis TaxID=130454 RepID=UPI0007AF06A3
MKLNSEMGSSSLIPTALTSTPSRDSHVHNHNKKKKPHSKNHKQKNNRQVNKWKSQTQQNLYSTKLRQALAGSTLSGSGKSIRETADRVLASAARGRSRWSRAILTNRLKLSFMKNKIKKKKKRVGPVVRSRRTRTRLNVVRLKVKTVPAVQKKVRLLGRLVPGCRKEPLPVILEEAIDYIPALEMQVRAMTALANLLLANSSSPSSSSNLNSSPSFPAPSPSTPPPSSYPTPSSSYPPPTGTYPYHLQFPHFLPPYPNLQHFQQQQQQQEHPFVLHHQQQQQQQQLPQMISPQRPIFQQQQSSSSPSPSPSSPSPHVPTSPNSGARLMAMLGTQNPQSNQEQSVMNQSPSSIASTSQSSASASAPPIPMVSDFLMPGTSNHPAAVLLPSSGSQP